jgi:proteasome alpha subunit
MPFYVSPEQVVNDKAQYARKNIAKGRPLVGMSYEDGVLLAAENSSEVLHKVSEIYDRIAFGGVGKYSEFDNLRRQGVQFADYHGYTYSREDVDGRSLANAYAQAMSHVFTNELKPLEVELLVAELGFAAGEDRLFRITFDGVVVDEDHFCVIGGEPEAIGERLQESWKEGLSLGDALRTARGALSGTDRTIDPSSLEVAVLARSNGRRAFKRIDGEPLVALLGG